MTYVLISAALVALFWLLARSISRERARRLKTEAIHARVMAEHALDEAFVSEADGGFVGISAAREVVVIGDVDAAQEFPLCRHHRSRGCSRRAGSGAGRSRRRAGRSRDRARAPHDARPDPVSGASRHL